MFVSSFFRDLLSSYQAEIDDLSFDSEGKQVFAKRRKERAKELGFLLQLIDTNPEMLSALFHGSFQFKHPAAMVQLVGQDPEELPLWGDLGNAVALNADALTLAAQVLAADKGDWLLTVAAGLEFLHSRGMGGSTLDSDEADDAEDDAQTQEVEDHAEHLSSDDEGTGGPSEEAGADWLADQGFERKDSDA
ncbi:hypothetical protein RQP54_12410 [Curvibacter sp. APW13]|uniref:hypothetical protein n=1 Tax=Curvibacter sp. APW13 TaxID=3077236 RepID=UPI0028E0137C|nr:hypothetical protein [Curvibacter sp. APW13]MDT8991664.1 hypothetical protein [Curvibacter sp. APW13]